MRKHAYIIEYRWEDEEQYNSFYEKPDFPERILKPGDLVTFRDFAHAPAPDPPIETKGVIVQENVDRSPEMTKWQWVLKKVID